MDSQNYIEISELKIRELEILLAFHSFCEENNLKYSLYAGTMIGAVRHKGFIPWDDDIDIAMMREDYMKFISLYPKDGLNGYKVLSPFTDKECPITYAKLYAINSIKEEHEVEEKYWRYGIDIDIFPWDGIPESEFERRMYFAKQYFDFKLFLGIVGRKRDTNSRVKTIIRNLYLAGCKLLCKLHITDANKVALRMNKRAMSYRVGNTRRVCETVFADFYGRPNEKVVDYDLCNEYITLPFENYEFYCFKGYDVCLKSLYGDYMKVPPVEQQITHHISCCYYIEKP